ncbi:6,7-dimethyl-8-ribityllumazine synthase [Desulfovibrio gilichinskyi]|uniref:6,7-dimethyl-8-ribityllumazine synthase n=1 Tax=Desulfovibrio gilichinskyi TaxID=1519643 RepID=A0A1X7CPT1_9BACT|nr:6,7-dimethyl-8-ribityllumazine synthase [Desulfovibrio gilichinskyi]SMF00680.1 6,7-dimethyl-8-ribityllumazine synthase [Desulfovibrio gilichinskyi]
MHHINTIEGQLDAKNLKIALIAGRFNDFIVERLIGGAVDYLVRHGCDKENITLIKVPGAFELPVVTKKVAETNKYNGIVALGAVIRGATPHFDFVSNECAKGIAQVSLDNNLPIGFGVLTCDTLEQAIERAGSKGGNKGVEAASAMLETIRVLEQI